MPSIKQGDARKRALKRGRPADLAEYQEYWNHTLGNPSHGLIGIIITMVFFTCLISLPWLMSFLQDSGIITPRLNLRSILPEPESAALDETLAPTTSVPEQQRASGSYGTRQPQWDFQSQPFGRPRSD
jgi:hypothetical protein